MRTLADLLETDQKKRKNMLLQENIAIPFFDIERANRLNQKVENTIICQKCKERIFYLYRVEGKIKSFCAGCNQEL